MIGRTIFSRLNGGTSAENRIYPLVKPQDAAHPAVTHQRIGAERAHAMSADSPIERYRVQLSCWADSYTEAQQLAREVETLLSRWSGTVEDVEVFDVLWNLDIDDFEEETESHRVIQDITMIVAKVEE